MAVTMALLRVTDAAQSGRKQPTRRITFNRMMLVFIGLFLTPFVLIGLHGIRTSLASAHAARETANWRETPATLQSCRVRVETDSEGDATYHLDVQYTYEHLGELYEGRTLARRTLAKLGKREAEALCEALQINQAVSAYVNPEHPEQAVLIPGSGIADYSGLAFGITFAGFALMFFVIVFLAGSAPDTADLITRMGR